MIFKKAVFSQAFRDALTNWYCDQREKLKRASFYIMIIQIAGNQRESVITLA